MAGIRPGTKVRLRDRTSAFTSYDGDFSLFRNEVKALPNPIPEDVLVRIEAGALVIVEENSEVKGSSTTRSPVSKKRKK